MKHSHSIVTEPGRRPGRSNRDPLLRVDEAAVALGLSPKTLRDWIAQRRLEIVRLGRAIRVSEAEVARIIADGTVPARRVGGR
jgi:excisionase family DNA binding protein